MPSNRVKIFLLMTQNVKGKKSVKAPNCLLSVENTLAASEFCCSSRIEHDSLPLRPSLDATLLHRQAQLFNTLACSVWDHV
ncbi:UNVERIFIED_CONTAM: hypothetical protein FKN15_026180 [Acipenser sinensis]